MPTQNLHEIEHQAWTQRASYYDALFAPVSTQAIDAILDSLEPLNRRGHLDIACGTGHLVAAASKRGAASEGIDFAQAMVEAARQNYPGECFQVADAAQLPYDDRSFDAVTCAFGLSHMEDPQAAVNEAFRVLRAGGQFAFTLWYSEVAGGELLSIVRTALANHGTTDFRLPDEWVRLRYADEQACEAVTRQAGFSEPVFKKLPIVLQTRSAQDVLDFVDKLSVRTKLVIDSQPPAEKQRIYEHILLEAEARRTEGVIYLDWPALLTTAQKPTGD